MEEKTIYTVQVSGLVKLEATSDTDAKDKALDYFSETPMAYISILSIEKILVEEPEQ